MPIFTFYDECAPLTRKQIKYLLSKGKRRRQRIKDRRAIARLARCSARIGERSAVIAAMIRQRSCRLYYPLNADPIRDEVTARAFDHSKPRKAQAERFVKSYLGKRVFQ